MPIRQFGLFISAVFISVCSFAQPCNFPFGASYSPAVVCSGRQVSFTSSFIAGASYAWSGPGGFSSSLQNPVIPSMPFLSSGIYTVTATVGTCVYTIPLIINVNFTPPTPLASNNGPVCPGQNIILNATTQGGTGVTYNWTGPSSYTASTISNQSPVNNLQVPKTGIYTVIATTSDGCSTDPATTIVNIYPEVKADFNFSVTQLCKESDEVIFTDLSTGNTLINWDFGDLTKGTGSPVKHGYPNQPVPPNTSTNYKVILIASNANCADTIFKTVTIGHPLKAAFAVDDDSICQHTKINFTDLSTFTPATAPQELWTFRDGATDNNILTTSHVYDRPGVYEAQLIVTDYLGCKDSAAHTIVVDSAGYVKIASSEDGICLGKQIDFTGDYMPEGLIGATWDMGDGNIIASLKNILHGYDKPGTYHISLSADYRICPDLVATKDITIRPIPVINLGPDKTICPNGAPVYLADHNNESNPNASWKWNSEVIHTASNMLVYSPGMYAATVSIDGCSATDSVEITKNCYINIPNAFTPDGDGNDDYFLPKELLSKGLAKFNMTIYNRWGQLIFKTDNTTGRGWDGKFNGEPQATGVFVYLIEATFINDVAEKYQGNVTLLR